MREETGLDVDVGAQSSTSSTASCWIRGTGCATTSSWSTICVEVVGGTLAAGGDAADAVLADPDALEPYGLVEKTREVIARAVTMRARPR